MELRVLRDFQESIFYFRVHKVRRGALVTRVTLEHSDKKDLKVLQGMLAFQDQRSMLLI